MAKGVIQNPNSIKGWDYLGSTTGDAHITIPSSTYKDVMCMVYVENNINQVITFSCPAQHIDARTYRQGYYFSSTDYYSVSIHNDTSGGWWGWNAGKNGTAVINTTKFFWYAR